MTPKLWEIPEVTEINRLPMTGCLVPYPTRADALRGDRDRSEFFLRLDGTWRFCLYESPESVPENAMIGETEPDGFRDIEVPANWTLQDTGDLPIYTDVKMPFENRPPFPPAENPTGVYRTEVDVPAKWHGRRIVIHFGGVESYFELYVEGEFVGMAKDSRLPSEFDITHFLRPGRNRITAKVLRFSDSSYVEDQDHWWMAGIYREVYLYSTAGARIDDVFAQADYDLKLKRGTLDLEVNLAFDSQGDPDYAGPDAVVIHAELLDGGEERWRGSAFVDPSFRVNGYKTRLHAEVHGASPWSSEDPHLYTLVVTLSGSRKKAIDTAHVIESRSIRVGFRRVEVDDRQLLINGKAVLICGVNRHEHHPLHGKRVDRALMVRDIELLKQFNFNAVRTSHYPDTIEWYELCDEYGIYLIDEANIESHANYPTICRDPKWRKAFEERMLRMVLRDKNHPSIIAWSSGNESGHGQNHISAISRVREFDPSRLIHHEGEVKPRWIQQGNRFTGGDNRYNDIVNPMYPEIESIVAHAQGGEDPRPVILCEYSHAMGNSNGSLAEYFDAFRQYHGLQGGFIWEWADHGIRRERADGKPYWAYGGDFGEKIHDGNFVADGLVSPDRIPHPAMWEHKKCAQPIEVVARSVSDGIYTIHNRYDFTSLEGLEGRWEIAAEGKVVERGDLGPLDVASGSSRDFRIDFDRQFLDMPETYVRFRFRMREKTAWCEAGHEVAWDEFAMSRVQNTRPTTGASVMSLGQDALPIDIEESDSGWRLRSGDELVLARGSYLNLFRAPIDNDGIRDWEGQEEKPMGQWLAAGLHELTCTQREVANTDRGVIEKSLWVGTDENAPVRCEQLVERTSASLVRVDCTIEIPASFPTLPRVGLLAETVPGYERVVWYGRGPQENHLDRKRGYAVGLYGGSVDDEHVPYLMPQENGSKCDVRWFELSNGSRIVRFSADPVFEFSVHHYAPRDLFSCRHEPDIDDIRRKETIIAIDHLQRGVGTGSCGPDTRKPYLLDPGTYRFSYWVECRGEK